MSEPYVIKRDGSIHDRETDQIIGDVGLWNGQWSGRLFGAGFPADPWQQVRVDPEYAGRRWSVARVVWQQWLKRRCSQCEADLSVEHGMCSSCLHDALRSGWEPPAADAAPAEQ